MFIPFIIVLRLSHKELHGFVCRRQCTSCSREMFGGCKTEKREKRTLYIRFLLCQRCILVTCVPNAFSWNDQVPLPPSLYISACRILHSRAKAFNLFILQILLYDSLQWARCENLQIQGIFQHIFPSTGFCYKYRPTGDVHFKVPNLHSLQGVPELRSISIQHIVQLLQNAQDNTHWAIMQQLFW